VQRSASMRYSDADHQVSTFRSAPITLDVGRVVLTPPKQTPLLMPPEPFVITSLRLEVVRASDGSSVPLAEVYNHHVVFYAGDGKIGADVCGGAHLDMLDGLWATGAEARNTVTEFPEGLALPGTGPWLTNIHLIRSENVPSVKRCIECACPTAYGGTEDCCQHKSICPGFPDGESARNASDIKQYALQYTVGWSADASKYELLRYLTLDATGCQLEFQVPVQCPWMYRHDTMTGQVPGSKGLRGSGRDLPSDFAASVRPVRPECTASVSYDYDLPGDGEGHLVFSKGHVHIGGLNLTVHVLKAATPDKPQLLCGMEARYGHADPGTANYTGDERGYVVGVSTCVFEEPSKRPLLEKGDRIRVTAMYRTDLWFNGVMGLADMAIVPQVNTRKQLQRRRQEDNLV